MKNRVLFLVILLGFIKSGFSQTTIGRPDIQNFSHEQSNIGAQTWKIMQDRFGIMYFANNSGLVSYNGKEWKKFQLPNKTIARSIYISDDDKIYVGGQGTIGYFFPDKQGSLKYHSLIDLIPARYKSFGDVWQIVEFENNIFFRTSNKIYKLDPKKELIKVFEGPNFSKWSFVHKSQNQLFAQNSWQNLVVFKNNNWEPLNIPELKSTEIFDIQDFGGDTSIISTLHHGLFLMNKTGIRPFHIQKQIIQNQIFSIEPVSNNLFAIGTVSNGIYIVDKNGNSVMHFSTDNGLQNNNVLSMFVDNHSNLWAGLDEGIDLINYKSPFTKIIPVPQRPTPTYAANIFNNRIYLGTSDGLYAADLTLSEKNDISLSQKPFYRVQNSGRQVWNLFNNGEQLLMAHHDGTFEIKSNTALFLDNYYGGAWLYRQIPGSKNLIAGTYDGIQLFINNNQHLIPTKKLSFPNKEPLRFIEIDSSHHIIWASHPYRGIYKVNMSANYDNIEKVQLYTQKDGLPANTNNFVFKINNQIVFTTENGVYEYDYENGLFRVSKQYLRIFGKLSIKFLTEDSKQRIWFATEQGAGVAEKGNAKFIPELNEKLIAGFENIYPFNDKNILIGSYKGIIHLNYSQYQKSRSKISVLLSKVVTTSNKDSILFNGYFNNNGKISGKQGENNIFKLLPKFSSFRFEFSTDHYEKSDQILYSYKLEGFDDEWSDWNNKNEKDYTNLSHGKYTFLLKAKDNFGNNSDPISYSFEILPRWYQTILARFIYFALLMLFFYTLNKLYQQRLIKQKANHEKEQAHLKYVHELELEKNEKEIIQLKNDKLETEVVYKNKELASTTMHLYKRGRLLGKIKEDLSEGIKKIQKKEEKSDFNKLLKLIIEEEKQAEDWEQFAIHFDDVHNRFLQKIKLAYPNLTSGDLKLCAYLKMNLSSKEIAQLLNISLKGVEIGRYRLRKKLGLGPNVNLAGFINEFG